MELKKKQFYLVFQDGVPRKFKTSCFLNLSTFTDLEMCQQYIQTTQSTNTAMFVSKNYIFKLFDKTNWKSMSLDRKTF